VATVTDALSALWRTYPALRDRIATEQGEVREHINVFVGDENIRYTGGLMSPVPAGPLPSFPPSVVAEAASSDRDAGNSRPGA